MKIIRLMGLCIWGMAVCLLAACSGKDNTLLEEVPQDTVVFMGGTVATPLDKVIIPSPLILDLVQEKFAESGPLSEPVQRFLTDFQLQINSGADALNSMFGIAKEANVAFYTFNMLPVFKVQLQDVAVFNRYFDTLEKTYPSGIKHQQHKGISYRILGSDDAGFQLFIAEKEQVMRIGLARPVTAYLDNLLGLEKPAKNLKTAGYLQQLVDDKKYQPGFMMYVKPEKLLVQYDQAVQSGILPASVQQSIEDGMGASCFAALRGQAASWPALNGGYQSFRNDAGRLTSKSMVEIELKPETVLQPEKFYGVVPEFLKQSAQPYSLALAQGLSVEQLLHYHQQLQHFIDGLPSECSLLAELQQAYADIQPMMLVAVFGAYDVQGIALAFDSIKINAEKEHVDGKGWLSVATKKPASLLQVLDGFPIFSVKQGDKKFSQMQAGDAWPVQVERMIYEELEVFQPLLADLVLKHDGHFLTLYIGGVDEAASTQLMKQDMTPNGSSLFFANLTHFRDVLQPVIADWKRHVSEANECILHEQSRQAVNAFHGQILYYDQFTPSSWQWVSESAEVTIAPERRSEYKVQAAEYTTRMLGDACEYETAEDPEILNADGTGTFIGSDEDDTCVTYENKYHWQQYGNRLVFHVDQERMRDDAECDGTLSDWEKPEPEYTLQSCTIIEAKGDRFVCLYYGEGYGEPFQIEYRKKL